MAASSTSSSFTSSFFAQNRSRGGKGSAYFRESIETRTSQTTTTTKKQQKRKKRVGVVVRAAAEKGAFLCKRRKNAPPAMILRTETNHFNNRYRGRGALQTLCAKKGKGPRNLPMDREYMFDPRIPRLKKGHKVRTTEDFEENHKAYFDQEPGELHELMSYERPQMIFPELPPKLTGGARVIPPRLFSKWLDPFIMDYWTVPRILKAQRIWDFEKDCKEVDALLERIDITKRRTKKKNYELYAPDWMKEQDTKLLDMLKKNKGFEKMLKSEKRRLLAKFRAQERTYPERFQSEMKWGKRLWMRKFPDWLDQAEKPEYIEELIDYSQLMRDLQNQRISRIKIYEEGKVAICEYEDEKHRLNYDRESYGVKKCNLPGDAWDDLVIRCQKASVTPDFVDFDVWETNPSSCQLFMHRSPLYFGSLLQTTLPWYGSMAFLTAIAMSRKKPEHWAVFQGNPAGKSETKKYKPPDSLKKDKKSKLARQLGISTYVLDQIISGKKTLQQVQKMSKEEQNEESKNPFVAMTKSKAKKISRRMSKVRFNDVAGLDEAVHEFQEVIDIMNGDPRFEGQIVDPPKGILLEGPPGTGKTLLAKAVAGEAMMPFFYANGSEFVEMFVGVAASRVRDLFKRARDVAPAIIFIDELDTLGKSRAFYDMSDPASQERAQGLMQLLVEMDGFDPNQTPILIIGATNLASNLDPALLRSGRFDRSFRVGNPKRSEDRLKILKVHAKKLNVNHDNDDAFLKRVSEITEDYSGADLANLLNEGAILSVRRDKEFMDIEDIEAVIEKQVVGLVGAPLPHSWGKEHLAILEASRAVICSSRPQLTPELIQVTLKPRGEAVSSLLYVNEPDHVTQAKLYAQGPDTIEYYVECAALIICGRVAERVFFGEDDVSLATTPDVIYAQDYISRIVNDTGITYVRDGKVRPHFDPAITEGFRLDKLYGKDDQQLMLKAAMKRAEQLVREYAPVIKQVASELLVDDRVYGTRVRELIEKFDGKRDDVSVIPTLVDTYPESKVQEVSLEKPEPWVKEGTKTRTKKEGEGEPNLFDLEIGARHWLNAATGGFYEKEENVDSAFDESRDFVTTFETPENNYRKNWTAFEIKHQLYTVPTIKEVMAFWVDEVNGVHDDWPDEWLPKWLQLDLVKYGGVGKPLECYRQMQRDRIAHGGGEEGFKAVMKKYHAGEYDKDWRGLSEKEQTRKKEIEAVGIKTDEKPFGSWQPFDDDNNASGKRPLYAPPGTGRLNDPKDVGPVSDDGYMSPSEEKKEEASSSDTTTTTPTTIPTTANEGEEKDFIKKAWQSQLGSSEVSPREERGTNSMSSSPLGSGVTEPSVSREVSTAWQKQGFDCTKIDRV